MIVRTLHVPRGTTRLLNLGAEEVTPQSTQAFPDDAMPLYYIALYQPNRAQRFYPEHDWVTPPTTIPIDESDWLPPPPVFRPVDLLRFDGEDYWAPEVDLRVDEGGHALYYLPPLRRNIAPVPHDDDPFPGTPITSINFDEEQYRPPPPWNTYVWVILQDSESFPVQLEEEAYQPPMMWRRPRVWFVQPALDDDALIGTPPAPFFLDEDEQQTSKSFVDPRRIVPFLSPRPAAMDDSDQPPLTAPPAPPGAGVSPYKPIFMPRRRF
jgi:hypothetical protein